MLIVDRDLPGGLAALQSLRQIERLPAVSRIPLLLLAQEPELGMFLGDELSEGCLSKPFSRSQLLNAILQIYGYPAHSEGEPVQKKNRPAGFSRLRGRRILLVEDNSINQLVAGEMLENLGLEVTLASNGEAAVQLVKTSHFHVVLMDIQMPGLDGYQATAQIRLEPHLTADQLPIIALTAHALVGDREMALAAGFNDYLTKPIVFEDLRAALLRWLTPQPDQLVEAVQTSLSLAQTEQVLPPETDLIDQKSALARLGHNEKLYQRLLALFPENQGQAVQNLRQALQAGDLPTARRLAHTLKGTAATLGAEQLSLAAKNLELACAEGNSAFYETGLEQVALKLALTLAEVKRLVDQTSPQPEPTPAPEVEAAPVNLGLQLGQLAQLLRESDAQAVAFIDHLLQQPHELRLQTELEAVRRVIRRYDFETALAELEQLAQNWQISLPKG